MARALRDWIPEVLQQVEVFMSGEDIEIGEPWLARIERELGESDVGILCLTPENLSAPWLLFEAGVLMRSATKKRVMPYLLGLAPTDVPQPLGMLFGCEATEPGTKSLILNLNKHTDKPIKAPSVERQFGLHWPVLKASLDCVPVETPKPAPERWRKTIEDPRAWLEASVAMATADCRRRTGSMSLWSFRLVSPQFTNCTDKSMSLELSLLIPAVAAPTKRYLVRFPSVVQVNAGETVSPESLEAEVLNPNFDPERINTSGVACQVHIRDKVSNQATEFGIGEIVRR